jgi:hypothetical protein
MRFFDENLDCSPMDFGALVMEGDSQKESDHGATISSKTTQPLQFPPSSMMPAAEANPVLSPYTCTDCRRNSEIFVEMLATPASTHCCSEGRRDVPEVAVQACEIRSLRESLDQQRELYNEGTSKSSSFDLTSIFINPTYLSIGATQATDAEAVIALIQLSQKIREYFERSKPASFGDPEKFLFSDREQVNIWIKGL